jgi:hypothetical protein
MSSVGRRVSKLKLGDSRSTQIGGLISLDCRAKSLQGITLGLRLVSDILSLRGAAKGCLVNKVIPGGIGSLLAANWRSRWHRLIRKTSIAFEF